MELRSSILRTSGRGLARNRPRALVGRRSAEEVIVARPARQQVAPAARRAAGPLGGPVVPIQRVCTGQPVEEVVSGSRGDAAMGEAVPDEQIALGAAAQVVVSAADRRSARREAVADHEVVPTRTGELVGGATARRPDSGHHAVADHAVRTGQAQDAIVAGPDRGRAPVVVPDCEIGAEPFVDVVIPCRTDRAAEEVGAVTDDQIVSAVASEHVIAGSANQALLCETAVGPVVAGSTTDRVVASVSGDDVVAAHAHDHVPM
jgi:hypothetical protein